MNNDLNITEEEYKQIKAEEDDDSIKVNHKNIKRVRIIKITLFFLILIEFTCINE